MKTSTKVIIGSGIVGIAVVLYFMLQNTGAVTKNGFEGKTDFDSDNQSIDDELMSPEDQEILENLEADNSLPSRADSDDNGNDNEVRPVETRRKRTDIGDRTSSGTRSSLNPRTDTRSSRSNTINRR